MIFTKILFSAVSSIITVINYFLVCNILVIKIIFYLHRHRILPIFSLNSWNSNWTKLKDFYLKSNLQSVLGTIPKQIYFYQLRIHTKYNDFTININNWAITLMGLVVWLQRQLCLTVSTMIWSETTHSNKFAKKIPFNCDLSTILACYISTWLNMTIFMNFWPRRWSGKRSRYIDSIFKHEK